MRRRAEISPVGVVVYDLPALTQSELDCAQGGQTYNEFCEQYGITRPLILQLADELDGYYA